MDERTRRIGRNEALYRTVVLPGHALPDVETVVEEHEGFTVVRKNPGGPEEVARALDPRS